MWKRRPRWGSVPTRQGILGPPETRRGKEGFFPTSFRGNIALLTPGFHTSKLPELGGNTFMLPACLPSHFSCIWLFATLWTIAHQVPLSMGFSRQEHWSGLPFPSPGDLLHPGIEPASLTSPSLAGGFFTTSKIYVTSSQMQRKRSWEFTEEAKVDNWYSYENCLHIIFKIVSLLPLRALIRQP